jgi:hypothetical protein
VGGGFVGHFIFLLGGYALPDQIVLFSSNCSQAVSGNQF